MHPDVDAAVFETARGGVLREGLGFDRCDVAVVTNIGMGDHLGLNYITTVEDLAVVKRVIVQNVAPHGLRGAQRRRPAWSSPWPAPARLGHLLRPRPPTTPCWPPTGPRAKRGVRVDGDAIVAAEGGAELPHAACADIPITRNGTIGFQVENVDGRHGRRPGRWACDWRPSAAAWPASSTTPATPRAAST